MFTTNHFITGTPQAHSIFLPDAEYSLALDCLVKACTDILLIRNDTKQVFFIISTSSSSLLVLLMNQMNHFQRGRKRILRILFGFHAFFFIFIFFSILKI
eukprot:TRINITY_DN1933_c0_g1_i1.p1 TRINITY_DN1933_c0_g1~~TRINITY_DN1933_c0_g1_i1.p1  ORF type:complete len:100 (-),score=10.18 TRINITY_DN1933_c0_g1_i1:56-355(-)